MSNVFRTTVFGLFLMLSISRPAFGHGFVLGLDRNRINATSEATISPHLFVGALDPFSATIFFADHGGVEAGSGFSIPPDTFGVEFLGRLWYSNGGTAVPDVSGSTLNATSFDSFGGALGNPVNLTGSSTDPGAFPVAGNDSHSIGWILSGNLIPEGAYGFAYRVTGADNGATFFEPSVPLVVAFNTPGFTGENLSRAQQAVFNAALNGDFNRDGKLTSSDISSMLTALADLNAYQAAYYVAPAEMLAIGDLDRDGAVTNSDIQSLLNLIASGGVTLQSVPEPRAAFLVVSAIGVILLTICGRHCRPLRMKPISRTVRHSIGKLIAMSICSKSHYTRAPS